jgi:hypothetical protein
LLVSVITKFQFSVPGGNTGLCHSNYPAAWRSCFEFAAF